MAALTTLDGVPTTVADDAVASFAADLDGTLLTPDSPGYDDARTIWNAMVDKRPGLIIEVESEEDVVAGVNFAREHRLLLSIRGAGHNIAGNAVCDGGLMISFERMKAAEVDAEARTVRVQPGATLGDLDSATQAHGLAVPTGINSTTGIAGLTLGGGFGWLSRTRGMTIDNLRSARVVTASGEVVTASEREHPDLFWGLRGGGGNFGVVTSFEFDAHPVGPEVLSGLIVHPIEDAPEVLRAYRNFAASAPDEVTVWVVMRKAPPLPFLSEEVHGTGVLVLAAFYAGDMAEGEAALAPLRAIGTPHADVIGPHPYAGWQQAFDPLLTPGERNYWKTHDFAELSDELLDTVLEYVDSLPDPQSEVFFAQLGGAQGRVRNDATAYQGRNAAFIMNVHGRWSDPAKDDTCTAWCREFWAATEPHATGEAYVNFLTEEESGRLRDAYGSSFERLVEVKNAWDPDNLFRMNHNVQPTA
ncbi:MAG TPA: FAD-binding oxidoreductase [Longimicrobiales bacterium]|nr:FAD-binding oxidoreductase [Longimicrobiales bacterium]